MLQALYKKLIPAFLFLYCIGIIVNISLHRNDYQWDFSTYYYAARAYSEGLNPYDENILAKIAPTPLYKFVYPPIALIFFLPLSFINFNTAFYLYIYFKCIVLICLVYLWKKKFLKDEADTLFYLFCLLAFNSAIYIDIEAGNISIIEQFIIWLAFYFYQKRRLLLFCIFILFAAAFKLTPLFFLFLLLFSTNEKKHLYFFGSTLIYISILISSYITTPHLFINFISSLGGLYESGNINPSTLALIGDCLHLLADNTGLIIPDGVHMMLYLIIITLIIFITLKYTIFINSGSARDENKGRIVLFLMCLLYVLILPRFKNYSYILLIVPTYFIIKRVRQIKVYTPLFMLVIISNTNSLPGFKTFFNLLWEYYPLLIAYYIWGLYIYDIFIYKKTNECLSCQIV